MEISGEFHFFGVVVGALGGDFPFISS